MLHKPQEKPPTKRTGKYEDRRSTSRGTDAVEMSPKLPRVSPGEPAKETATERTTENGNVEARRNEKNVNVANSKNFQNSTKGGGLV